MAAPTIGNEGMGILRWLWGNDILKENWIDDPVRGMTGFCVADITIRDMFHRSEKTNLLINAMS
jgi:hypothetical protein